MMMPQPLLQQLGQQQEQQPSAEGGQPGTAGETCVGLYVEMSVEIVV